MIKSTNKLWTEQEEELLSSIFPTQGIKASAVALNRSESSVAKKASRLGLKSRSMFLTHEQYEEKLFDKQIDYWPTEKYVNIRTLIEHECLNGHRWKIAPHEVLKGNGCPMCATWSFKTDKPAILYYIKITYKEAIYYKLGITGQGLRKRFQFDSEKKIEPLFIKEYSKGEDALNEERRLLALYADKRVYIPGFLKSNGNSELFVEDILQLDSS